MAFLAKLFGKKKDNTLDEETLVEEEGLTPEEEAAAEAAEAALLNGEEPVVEKSVVEEPVTEEFIAEEPAVEEPVVEEPVVEEPVVEEPVVEEPVEDEPEEIEETATKKSFWGRLKSGLTKTRSALFAPVDNLLKAFTKVDEDLLEELEEILISADVGFAATEEIMDDLRERIKDGRLKEKEQVIEIAVDDLEKAKKLLMQRDGLTEPQAHRALQQYAMNHGLRMADCAAQIIKGDGGGNHAGSTVSALP